MLRWIVASSLRFRFLVIAAGVAMMYWGTVQIDDIPVDVFPEFAPPRVEIQTLSVGLSPEEVEALVTVPLEEVLSGIEGIDIVRSKSVPDLSSILLIFKPETDLILARQQVQEQIAIVTPNLPTWASPPFILQPLSATSRVMKIGITSDEHSLIDLSMLAYWKIRSHLLAVPGVANVAIWGERLEMLQLQVDPKRMQAHNVTLDEVMEVTADALDVGLLQYSYGAIVGTGGFIDTPNQRLAIRHVLPIERPADMAQVPIRIVAGEAPVRLGDVADVRIDHQPMIGDAIIDDGPGLLLIVEKFPWGNSVDVTKGVEEAIEAMSPGLPGIKIDTEIFRPATFIELSLENLSRAMLTGALLIIAILLVFLYEWRTALITVVAIPLSLMAAVLVLAAQGATINVMVLAGLIVALGELVDDAIIDVENIVRRLRQHRQQGSTKSTASIILSASLEVRVSIVYATLIVIVSVIPVFLMQGLSGAFFRPLATAYVLALLASLLVALTVTPALSYILLHRSSLAFHESPLARWLRQKYDGALASTIGAPRFTTAAAALVVAAGLATLPQLGQQLLPDFKERDFLMHWLTKPGTSLPEMDRITIAGSKELRAIPGVRNFGAHIGQAYLADEVVGVYFGENWISVDPAVNYEATLARIQETVNGFPGLYRDVQTYLKERIREVLTGTSDSIVVRIYGPDLGVLRAKADEVGRALEDIRGIVDVHVEFQTQVPQVVVEVDLAAAQRYGIKPGDVRRASATLLAGTEVGDIHTSSRTYDVQVWSTPATRNSLTDIRELLIDTPNGGRVKLEDVANVSIEPTPNTIIRENASRRINVEANVAGRDLGSVAREVRLRLQGVSFPLEYDAELVGEFQEFESAQSGLLGFAVVSAVVIFFLLQAAFRSWRLALLAFLALPAALVGGVIAAFLGGGMISLGSLVGFLTVLGVATRNGIMMITHFQHLERHEGEAFGPALVRRGARERLAPILMTALAAGLALLPLVLAGSIAGHEIEHPMAVVILGGLVTSTLVNLFIVPALYLRFRGLRPVATPAAQF